MPKLKTNRSVKKRMRITKSGKVKHFKAGRGHLLTLKKSKRRRLLGKPAFIEGQEAKTIKLLLPYGA
jgi:large subunit ribosomal protein L35